MSPKNHNSHGNSPAGAGIVIVGSELLDREEEDSEVDIDQPDRDSDGWKG